MNSSNCCLHQTAVIFCQAYCFKLNQLLPALNCCHLLWDMQLYTTRSLTVQKALYPAASTPCLSCAPDFIFPSMLHAYHTYYIKSAPVVQEIFYEISTKTCKTSKKMPNCCVFSGTKGKQYLLPCKKGCRFCDNPHKIYAGDRLVLNQLLLVIPAH